MEPFIQILRTEYFPKIVVHTGNHIYSSVINGNNVNINFLEKYILTKNVRCEEKSNGTLWVYFDKVIFTLEKQFNPNHNDCFMKKRHSDNDYHFNYKKTKNDDYYEDLRFPRKINNSPHKRYNFSVENNPINHGQYFSKMGNNNIHDEQYYSKMRNIEKRYSEVGNNDIYDEKRYSEVRNNVIYDGNRYSELEKNVIRDNQYFLKVGNNVIRDERFFSKIRDNDIYDEKRYSDVRNNVISDGQYFLEVGKNVIRDEKHYSELEKNVIRDGQYFLEVGNNVIRDEKRYSELEKSAGDDYMKGRKMYKKPLFLELKNPLLNIPKNDRVYPGNKICIGHKHNGDELIVDLDSNVLDLRTIHNYEIYDVQFLSIKIWRSFEHLILSVKMFEKHRNNRLAFSYYNNRNNCYFNSIKILSLYYEQTHNEYISDDLLILTNVEEIKIYDFPETFNIQRTLETLNSNNKVKKITFYNCNNHEHYINERLPSSIEILFL